MTENTYILHLLKEEKNKVSEIASTLLFVLKRNRCETIKNLFSKID